VLLKRVGNKIKTVIIALSERIGPWGNTAG
jgi:hypothetical protein